MRALHASSDGVGLNDVNSFETPYRHFHCAKQCTKFSCAMHLEQHSVLMQLWTVFEDCQEAMGSVRCCCEQGPVLVGQASNNSEWLAMWS